MSRPDDLPAFATPSQMFRKKNRYNLYQQQQQQQPLYTQQAPAELLQPNAIPHQQTGAEAKEYEKAKKIFMSFDKDRSNSLSEKELTRALYNSDGTKFESSTVRLMIKLFDSDNNQTLDFREFYFLTKYLTYWNATFQKADANRSGTISLSEFTHALQNFGYQMNFHTSSYIFNLFATTPRGHRLQQPQVAPGGFNYGPPQQQGYNPNFMKFDKFVESLIWILRLTSVFRKYDTHGNASATFGFEQFLCEGLNLIN